MARHSSSMMRDGHTRIAPVPALSARADEAIKEQDKGFDYHWTRIVR